MINRGYYGKFGGAFMPVILNVMGQGLLVKRMGKTRVIAETGAGSGVCRCICRSKLAKIYKKKAEEYRA